MAQRKQQHMAPGGSAYALLDDGSSSGGPPAAAPALSHHTRSRRLRRAALLTALTLGLCTAFAALSWSTRLRACNRSSFAQQLVEDAVPLRLTASPARVEDGGDIVVSWPERSDCVPQPEDYVTLSCGAPVDDDDYFQRRNVTELDAMPNSVRFSDLYMMRCTYVVKYFMHDRETKRYHVAAQLDVPMKASVNAPKHGHIALSERDDEMVVMYNSASSRTPLVRYGRQPDALAAVARGASTTYRASDMCHAPANTTRQRWFRDPGFMHKVVLTALEPDEVYFYQFGNDADGWSSVRSFRSKPPTRARTAKFIAYGDMGVDNAPAAQSTAARVFSDVVGAGYDSFLLHFGDVSYARGEAHIWDQYFHLIEPYATRVPYMVSIGNHEYDYTSGGEHDPSGGAGASGTGFHPSWGNYGADSGGECSVPMLHRWHAPATGNGIYWYSFDYAGVHVVQISTEHDWTRGSAQFEWLKRDLESVDRSATPWIVLTAHRMMYTTQIMGTECTANLVAAHMRSELEDLLYANRVNLMLVGHQHAYERSCAVYRGECRADGRGTVHVLAGAAGFEIDTTEFSTACGNWSLRHVNAYGYLRVATTAHAMHLEFVLNANGAVYDEVTVLPWTE